MPLFNFDLATKGMDQATKLRIIKRHLFSFIRHITVKKLLNFLLTEYNRFQKKTYVSSFPYILKIESTNICNLKCAYCYDNRRMPHMGERPYGRMPGDNFRKLIDELSPYLFKINLYGFGEPFLFPETIDMITYASERNIGVGISSNMNFEDPYLPRNIVKSGLEVLIFSCHGVTQHTYSKFMVNGDMELAMRNIKKVIGERQHIGSKTPLIDWQFCVTKFNEREIAMAKEKAREIGIDQIRFIKPFFPEYAEDEWFSSLFPKNISQASRETKAGCSWIYRSAYVSYDGGVLPCCKDFRLLASDFGNVFKEAFGAIWNNDNYRRSRQLIAHPQDRSIRCDTICARCPITTGL
jgi:MoaA/NifB/PqqE/SkfB family radical SAM enzyme